MFRTRRELRAWSDLGTSRDSGTNRMGRIRGVGESVRVSRQHTHILSTANVKHVCTAVRELGGDMHAAKYEKECCSLVSDELY